MDNACQNWKQRLKRGSPPRAWGQSPFLSLASEAGRFTPTGVGTIRYCAKSIITTTVHPHGRGDNYCSTRSSTRRNGSPPRAWGQSLVIDPGSAANRFTPTGVGTISTQIMRRCAQSVHPHGRGDNNVRSPRLGAAGGSPPRAWGQYERHSQRCNQHRFTPTGVGTMCARWPAIDTHAVHPHGRGDNFVRICQPNRPAWFTPTGVGTILLFLSGVFFAPVHPHGRGDNYQCSARHGRGYGSPPRAWGQCNP